MRKTLVLSLAVLFVIGIAVMASATDADFSWTNAESVSASLSQANSSASLTGSFGSGTGEFHARDDSYERVEVTGATGVFNDGGTYSFEQYNDLKGGESSLGFMASSDDGSGFVNFVTDEWRTGNDIKPRGYSGGPVDWSGTNQPAFGASGSNFTVNFGASWDQDEDGTAESSYSGTVLGSNGGAAIGTWNAGSTDILQAGGNINGNILGQGSGSGTFTQSFNDVGSITSTFHWD